MNNDGRLRKEDEAVFAERTSDIYLLIGTRNGDILEVKLLPTIVGTLNEEDENSEFVDPLDNQLIIDKIDYEWNNELLARNHSVQLPIDSNRPFDSLKHKKVNIALHPELSIMVTSGSDQQIFFWDTEEFKPFYSNSYRKTPTCIKFTPDGQLLVIGFEHGAIEIYGCQMKRQVTGTAGSKFSRPDMDIKQTIKDKETRTAVLNMEFSSSGDYMAASYDNQKVNREEEEGKSKEGSFVVVYVRNASHLKNLRTQSSDSKAIYSILTEIRRPSVNETFSSEHNIYGMAVFYMAFSADDMFLMIYFQITDNFQIRNNEDKEGIYTLWDLQHNNQINTWEALKNIPFGKFNFPNHIYGLYQYYDGNLAELSNKQDEKYLYSVLQQKTNIVVSSIGEYLMNLFLGSINGDIHIVKKTALYFEKDGIADNINKSRLCQSKSYIGHVSFVNQIEIDSKETSRELCLYTTGINDQCVFQWSIQIAELYWDLDHMPHDITKEDVFMGEVEPHDKFFNIMNEQLPLRDEIIELQQK